MNYWWRMYWISEWDTLYIIYLHKYDTNYCVYFISVLISLFQTNSHLKSYIEHLPKIMLVINNANPLKIQMCWITTVNRMDVVRWCACVCMYVCGQFVVVRVNKIGAYGFMLHITFYSVIVTNISLVETNDLSRIKIGR